MKEIHRYYLHVKWRDLKNDLIKEVEGRLHTLINMRLVEWSKMREVAVVEVVVENTLPLYEWFNVGGGAPFEDGTLLWFVESTRKERP